MNLDTSKYGSCFFVVYPLYRMDDKTRIVFFNSRDELLRVDLNAIVYFEADGNYTKFVSVNGLTSLVFISLGSLEQLLALRLKDVPGKFARIGKSYIVNLDFIYRINTLKQELVLSDQRFFSKSLSLSKLALKNLKEIISPSIKTEAK